MSSEDDLGTIQAMLDRLNHQRLPRVLDMKTRVDRGQCLGDSDLDYLEQIFAEANAAKPLLARHPELEELVGKLVGLYSEVTQKALDNEKGM